jgi:hypothetical protein
MFVGDLVACEHLYGLILKKKTSEIVLVYWLNAHDHSTSFIPASNFEWCGIRSLIKIQ